MKNGSRLVAICYLVEIQIFFVLYIYPNLLRLGMAESKDLINKLFQGFIPI